MKMKDHDEEGCKDDGFSKWGARIVQCVDNPTKCWVLFSNFLSYKAISFLSYVISLFKLLVLIFKSNQNLRADQETKMLYRTIEKLNDFCYGK